MGLDLGAIGKVLGAVGDFIPGPDFFDLGSAALNWAGKPPVVANPQVVVAGPTVASGGGIGGGGIPNLPVSMEGGSCEPEDPMQGYVMKKVCGQWRWIKPKRRRRRALLTETDYNSLLKLQTLKVNSNMNIAIAKAIGR